MTVFAAGPRRWGGWPVLLLGAALCGATCGARAPGAGVERIVGDTVAFHARVTAGRFERQLLGMPGYHYVVWGEGTAGGAALFQSAVSDSAVLAALESLGGRPGNALGMETWERRQDSRHPAPDKIIEGPPVEVLVRLPGAAAPLAMDRILLDPGGRGFDMRLGGHRANIHRWHSGCVVCLFSCPGSKVGNARYTVRDYVRETTRFRVRPGVLPADGTEVVVMLRLLPPPASRPTTTPSPAG